MENCKECGRVSDQCSSSRNSSSYRSEYSLQRNFQQREIENLKAGCIGKVEDTFETAFPMDPEYLKPIGGGSGALQNEIHILKEKYERLLDAHKRVQNVNQNLEDKLLKIADKFETEKCILSQEVRTLNTKLVDARLAICDLEEENKRYRNDCNIAVQLLQCNPTNFVSHKLNSMPIEIQERVKCEVGDIGKSVCEEDENGMNGHNNNKLEEPLRPCPAIRAPISTFPPTAMVYCSVQQLPQVADKARLAEEEARDDVSKALIAKVLEPSSPHRRNNVYLCQKCGGDVDLTESSTQTNDDHVANVLVPKMHRTHITPGCDRFNTTGSPGNSYF